MNITDPVSDLLTRIRNANKACFESLLIPYSKLKEGVLKVLKEEGFIKSYEVAGDGIKKNIVVIMKYAQKGEKVISQIVRVSKPSKRVYVGHDELRPIKQGRGIAILSTPKGVLTEAEAKKQKVGGEWLCSVW